MKTKQELIASDLAQKIRSHMYRTGEFLPSENQLTELYGTSRETIRNALAILNDLGMIQKIRGKGSLVIDAERFSLPISGITSFKELNERLGMRAETKVLACHPQEEIPCYFQEHGVPNQACMYVERLRYLDTIPSVLDCDYLLAPIQGITEEIAQNSLYEYIEEELGLEIAYATKEITVEPATSHLQAILPLEKQLVVVVRSMSYLQNAQLFQLTESYHCPDKFKFTDFARRNKLTL